MRVWGFFRNNQANGARADFVITRWKQYKRRAWAARILLLSSQRWRVLASARRMVRVFLLMT